MTANIIPISDWEDPSIADYTSVRERDLTGRQNKFIIEGKVTLEVALTRSRFAIESVLLNRSRASSLLPEIQTHLGDIPVYVTDQAVMDKIAGFPVHRGILACGRKPEPPPLQDWITGLDGAQTLVVAIGLSNHDNAGAIFRNCAALGADAVLLDQESCDPLYRKSIRVSAGTALWLPFHHGATPDAVFNALSTAGYHVWTLTPRDDATSLYEARRPEKLAIVLGPEGPGLTDEQIASGTAIRIPMSNEVDSLNVATSLAIALSVRFSAG
ncbi:MAG: RNA methyltransferase [Ponticaulis sp.]|nr:RNA methyltransferase [Ponticaulis sp.]